MGREAKEKDIDPALILDSFRKADVSIPPSARVSVPVPEESPPPKEGPDKPEGYSEDPAGKKGRQPPRRKGRSGADYGPLFLHESPLSARSGKTVYIRKEFHERIQRIIRIIAKDEVSMFSYIDNVLARHFEEYQDEIVELYESNNSIF